MRPRNIIRVLVLAMVGLLVIPIGGVGADQVILDDLIVDGSVCVGFDCVNGESFGFDTMRLKENNLRIRAQDTSTSASFPTNDWQITFNDTSNGGANKFSIDDIDGGKTPFTIEAGAPSHSLYVEDGGRVGFGTSTPVVDLHVKSGNTPTLRLEQDGTSGFTPQTWDLAGNEANFFIRDATNGSALPFRIEPGTASNTLYLASDEFVGLGTTSPSEELHISTAEIPEIKFQDTSTTDGSTTWDAGLTSDGSFKFSVNDATGSQLRFDGNGAFKLQPVASAPTGAWVTLGSLYVDSDGDGALCVYIGTGWVQLTSGTGGNCT